MSDMMALFFAKLIPYFAFLWALSLLLFYRTIYHDMFEIKDPASNVSPALTMCLICALIVILPLKGCIRAVAAKNKLNAVNTKEMLYENEFHKFPTDYD